MNFYSLFSLDLQLLIILEEYGIECWVAAVTVYTTKIWLQFMFQHCNSSSWKFQGRVIPCDFIGVVKSQQPVYLKGT